MKNGDAQIACLRHRVSHYKVIEDMRPGTSPISIHWRHANSERVSDLIPDWGPYGTNTRRAQGHASPVTKKSETHFILVCHPFNCGWGHCGTNRKHTLLHVSLLFHAPYGHPSCWLHHGARQDLAATLLGWRSHIHQHTHIETYIEPNGDHTVIIFTNQLLNKVYVSSNYYTKNNCQLTQSLYTEMKFSLWTNDLRHDERR
jgi:hypothetical protein